MPFPNPPLITGNAPTDGQVVAYQAATNEWIASTAVSGVTIPQAAISGASTVGTADAATQTGSYVQADVQSIAALANATKAAYNTLEGKFNQLLTELHTAGILS